MNAQQFLVSFAIGVVLLAGLVAFALLPSAGAHEEAAPPADEAAVSEVADREACRTILLVLAQTPYEQALDEVSGGLELERQGGDGGSGFYDWVDTEALTQTLGELSDGIRSAATFPGLSEELHAEALDVVEAATALDVAVNGSMFVLGEVNDARIDLGSSILALRDLCA